MQKVWKKISQNYHILFLFGFLIVMLVIHQNLYLWKVDDNFYNVVGKCDLKTIFDFLEWHYFYKNGRIWVHFLVVMFLKFDVYLWRVVNPIVFTLLAYFTGRLVSENFKDRRNAIVFSVIFYLIVDYHYITSAVYWLSSSFNYLLPMLLLVITIFFYREKRYAATLICVVLVGFGTEQSSMMLIGFFILSLINKFVFLKDKRFVREIIYIVISVIGLVTVLAFPGLNIRMGVSGDESFLNLASMLLRLYDIVYLDWLGKETSISFMLLITGSTSFALFCFEYKSRMSKMFNRVIGALLIILCIANIYCILVLNRTISFIYFSYVVLLGFSLLYVSAVLVLKKKRTFPVIMLILGIGSQVMMCITDAWILRTCFPGVVCFSLYILSIVGVHIEALLKTKAFISFLIIFFALLLVRNVNINLEYFDEHDIKIESYCKEIATQEDYEYVKSEAETGYFWYEERHEDFFENKVK